MNDFNREMARINLVSSVVWWAWGCLCFGLFHFLDISLSAKMFFTSINAALWMQAFSGWQHHLRVNEIKEYCLDEIEKIMS